MCDRVRLFLRIETMKRFVCAMAAGLVAGVVGGAEAARPQRPAAGDAERPAAQDPVLMLRQKVQKVTALADEREKAGQDVTAVRRLVAAAKTAVSEGKLREANQALERALGILEPKG